MDNPDSFNIIWKYFGLANQALSIFTLWAVTVYLALKGRYYFITLIPAMFMTWVCISFLCVSKQALGLSPFVGYGIAFVGVIVVTAAFFRWLIKDHVRIQRKRDYIMIQKQRLEEGKRAVIKDDVLTQTPVKM